MSVSCYHCGEVCDEVISVDDHAFCCQGCKQVYLLLSENNLCTYYNLDKTPGIKAKGKFISERYAYLDDPATIHKLIQFSSATQTNVTFSLPQMHCSSCIYLLENLHRINQGIQTSQVNFQRKEIFLVFNPQLISLRKVVELLAFIGYEPYISLQDSMEKKSGKINRKQIYKIGVAGFCFSNIMMLSFPEYFSGGKIDQTVLKQTFVWISFGLSFPVLFFAASGFFISAYKGLRQKFINIDAPIALAILVAFGRSYYEIISGTGPGYLDSASGIVFFMLIGRWFQDKTYDSLSFERDYKSYFPLGVTVINDAVEKNIPVTQLKKGDHILIRNQEMVPADAMLLSGSGNLDYSFVSGENDPILKKSGELIYAGGKQIGSAIELEIVNEVSHSYITQLWNNDIFTGKKNTEQSFVHPWSRYFTVALFSVALSAVLYWWLHDTTKILPALTSVLIVACPCSLLLSATFTYGNMLRIFGKNKLYLKNANVIESLAKIDTIVFDKTGTLTQNNVAAIHYEGEPLTFQNKAAIKSIAKQSSHPLSKVIANSIADDSTNNLIIADFNEYAGKGLNATVNNDRIQLGSAHFVGEAVLENTATAIYLKINDVHLGKYVVQNSYRSGVAELVKILRQEKFDLHLLSGDNDAERNNLKMIFGKETSLLFHTTPQQKLEYIRSLQEKNHKVLMLGDGLNDAGALKQSQVGIAVNEHSAQFSPACDAILDGAKVSILDKLIRFAKTGKTIVTVSFILSILYNIVGLSFAVQAKLSPMIAAILMPASSISIVLLVTLLSSLNAKRVGL